MRATSLFLGATTAILSMAIFPTTALPTTDISPTDFAKSQPLAKPDALLTSDWCEFDGGPATERAVIMHNETQYEQHPAHSKCGEGFVNDFRGRCGVITTWQCTYYNDDGSKTADQSTSASSQVSAVTTFFTNAFSQPGDITAAIGAASFGKQNVGCSRYDGGDGGDIPGPDLPFGGGR